MIYYIELLINNVLVNLMSMYIKIEYDISLLVNDENIT